ncbi:ABC transporter permease [Virgibacillus xinjiangensis]|uniref:ABC transporter permease n=1 Tax=Virgibacillus xinjiangensis TaxID=393090 RepID=A0ABV7CWE4_9BACI
MFNARELFRERLSEYVKETSRYLRYIFNGHLMITMFFFISVLAYYYQGWLTQLPNDFPAALVIGLGFGLIASYSPVRTLLQEPDLVFLIPAEHKMGPYFRNSLIYSFMIQLYLVFLVAAALGPLYFAAYPERTGKMYLLTVLVLLIFKLWNLFANWWMQKVREPGMRKADAAARTFLGIAVFYFAVNGDMLWAGITTVVYIIVFLYDYMVARQQPGIHWELLVEKDRNRMQAFYRIANMFADVPHLKNRVKKRQWLVNLVSNVPFARRHTFDYLYRITFVRSGDYLGMYVRLVIIGGLFIYLIPNLWLQVLFALLFLYLSCFQMMALYQHHRTMMWLDIYPVEVELRRQAVVKLLYQLTLGQVILFSLLFLAQQEYTGFVLTLVGGGLFTYLFMNGYVKKKITA